MVVQGWGIETASRTSSTQINDACTQRLSRHQTTTEDDGR